MRLDQIGLVTAIISELARQGLKNAEPRYVNAAVDAANDIIRKCERPIVRASEGMGLQAWLSSDDVGSSSRFMAHVLASAIIPRDLVESKPHPLDPSDLGRCLRFLSAVPGTRAKLAMMAKCSPVWKGLVEIWSDLEATYNAEKASGNAKKTYAMMRKVIEAGK